MNIRKLTIIFIILFFLLGLSNAISATRKSISFFSPKSLYFYIENGYFGINPYNPYNLDNYDWKNTFIYGAGFIILNMYNKYKFAFEFDHASPHYNNLTDKSGLFDQQVDFYNYKLNFEYILKRNKFSIFTGVGASHIVFRENNIINQFYTDTFVLEFGIKYFLSKHLALRSEYKLFSYSDAHNYYDYYDYYNEENAMALALAVGLEIKL